MKISSLLLSVAAGVLLAACSGAEQIGDDQRAVNDAAAAVTAATVQRATLSVPVTAPAGWTEMRRDVLDKLVPAAPDSPLAAADSLCSNAPTIVAVIEHVVGDLPEVPHIARYRQRVATAPVVVGTDSVSAEMLVDLDWPDATLDPNRHLRHWLNDRVFETLNSQFPQPKDKESAVKQYLQALDDPAEMMRHYAGQYSRAYKTLLGGDLTGVADPSALACPSLVARVRAVSDDWVTYYVAAVDRRGAPAYCFVSLNRLTGEPMQTADVAGKDKAAALEAALGGKPDALAATPDGFIATRLPSTVIFF